MEPVPAQPASDLAPLLPEGRFGGRIAFADTVRLALQAAPLRGWQHLILCDADFADWPLGDKAVVESLTAWSCRGRRFTMLASSYEAVVRLHPRFVTWRKTWDHLIDCRRIAPRQQATLPSALWTTDWAMERIDIPRCVGMAGTEARRRVRLQEQLGTCMVASTPAFPATVLGL